jgi:hypothetical protein
MKTLWEQLKIKRRLNSPVAKRARGGRTYRWDVLHVPEVKAGTSRVDAFNTKAEAEAFISGAAWLSRTAL